MSIFLRAWTARAVLAVLAAALGMGSVSADTALIIAHRGASAYLPEHSMPAKALAHAQGAHFIEQDVVLSRDGVPIVLHDLTLDATTDVAERFPGRARDDGRYYAIDFDFGELRELSLRERRTPDGQLRYPHRFPRGASAGRPSSLQEEIEFLAGLDASTGRSTGLYIEPKDARFHTAEGYDLAGAVVEVLEATGAAHATPAPFLQSFEPELLKTLRRRLGGATPPLVQLIGDNRWQSGGEGERIDHDSMRTVAGLEAIAAYADAIGPWIGHLVAPEDSGAVLGPGLVAQARAAGLVVHPYTLRADDLPPGFDTFEELAQRLFRELGVDGVFTDFPDRLRTFLSAGPAPGPGPGEAAAP